MFKRHAHFEYLLIVAVLAMIGLTRLPFLGTGYGADPDAWRVANAARHISQTGTYEASRLPGYPVQEIVCSFFWKGGPLALNGLTALMSLIAVLFFMLILRHYSRKNAYLAGLALGMAPLFYVNSVTAMDYMWAVAFLMAAWYLAIQKEIHWIALSGVALGLATGCRITTLVMILPLMVLMAQSGQKWFHWFWASWRKWLVLITASIGMSAICYWPVWRQYGKSFWSYVPGIYPSTDAILGCLTVRTWGYFWQIMLAITVVSVIFYIVWYRKILRQNTQFFVAVLLAILLATLVFLKLPAEVAYLLPVVPLIVFLMSFLPKSAWVTIFLLLILSPYERQIVNLTGLPTDKYPVTSIWEDQKSRLSTFSQVEWLLGYRQASYKTIVVAGWYLPQLEAMAGGNPSNEKTKFVYLISPDNIDKYLKQGYNFVAGSGVDSFEYLVYKVRLPKETKADSDVRTVR